MELSQSEARDILKAHRIDVDCADPRSAEEIAAQFMFTGTVALTDFLDNSIEIRERLWQVTAE